MTSARLRDPDKTGPGTLEFKVPGPVCQDLRKLGLPLRKKSPHASERDTPVVQAKRPSFRKKIAPIEPGRLIFVDQTGVATAMTPAYGRAPQGERVDTSTPASWETVTVIAALRLDGVRAPLAFPGVVNAAIFESYEEPILVPALREGDVVVFDNLTSYRGSALFEAITPIEEMLSKFKGFLRRVGARAKKNLYDAIGDGLQEVTLEDIFGWFQHAGWRSAHP